MKSDVGFQGGQGRGRGSWEWSPQKGPGERMGRSDRSLSRGRREDEYKEGEGGKDRGQKSDKCGGKRGGAGGKGLDPRAQRCFTLCKEEGRLCPSFQSNTCRFPGRCNLGLHGCYPCSSSRHGAIQCTQLQSDATKKQSGM